jgi:predicted DNA-binding transcriptional regulator AlpA
LPSLRRREVSFPQPIRVSPKVLRWDEEDINFWLVDKKESSNGESE